MADHDKTEKPTPKRKHETRKKGQVAKSTDLNGAVVLVAGLIGLLAVGPAIVSGVSSSMRSTFAQISNPGDATSAAGLHALFSAALHTILGDRRADRRPVPRRRCDRERRPGLVQALDDRDQARLQEDQPAHGRQEPVRGPGRDRGDQVDREGVRRRRRRRDGPAAAAHEPRREHRHPSGRARDPDQLEHHGHRRARRDRLPADRDPRLHLSALPPQQAAEDDQAGDQGGEPVSNRRLPRSAARSAGARCRPPAPA